MLSRYYVCKQLKISYKEQYIKNVLTYYSDHINNVLIWILQPKTCQVSTSSMQCLLYIRSTLYRHALHQMRFNQSLKLLLTVNTHYTIDRTCFIAQPSLYTVTPMTCKIPSMNIQFKNNLLQHNKNTGLSTSANEQISFDKHQAM